MLLKSASMLERAEQIVNDSINLVNFLAVFLYPNKILMVKIVIKLR